MRFTLVLLSVLMQMGCTSVSLRQHTVTQAGTWADISYRQVMDNLAMVANSPDILPCYSVVDAGTITINDTFGINGLLNILPSAPANGMFDPMASRSIAGNWVITQVTGPEKLRTLHLAFKYAVCNDPALLTLREHRVTLDSFTYPCESCALSESGRSSNVTNEPLPEPQRPSSRAAPCIVSPPSDPADNCVSTCPGVPGYYFSVASELEAIPPGWLHTGTKSQVPKCTRFVAKCCNTYVWVTEEDMSALSSFTLIVQRIARTPTEMVYAPAPYLTAVTPDQIGSPKVIQNCETAEKTVVISQITLPIDCYGNVIISKLRGDAIQTIDSKLKSALTGAIKTQ